MALREGLGLVSGLGLAFGLGSGLGLGISRFDILAYYPRLALSVYFDLIECTHRCEIYSPERQIALSFQKRESFVLLNLPCWW